MNQAAAKRLKKEILTRHSTRRCLCITRQGLAKVTLVRYQIETLMTGRSKA